MAIVATSIPEVQDIMDSAAEREMWIVAREMERAPYWTAGKGGDTRLARAIRLVSDEKVTPNSDGSFTVQGSEGRTYRIAERCSCPRAQQGVNKFCAHQVAVTLYIEWQRRLGFTPQGLPQRATLTPTDCARRQTPVPEPDDAYPVDDQTLPLALPPVTVDERFAQIPVAAPRSHEEPDMPADDDGYIPEPEMDDAPVAVLERPTKAVDSVTVHPLTTALAQWSAQRQVVNEFLRRELHEGTDYYRLTIRGKETKPSLSKAGAEKVLGLLQLHAAFSPDLGTWEMLGKPTDQVLYVCQLRTRSGEIVGEGRGARSVKQDGGDLNKAIKMSEKSSLIDAVLRTGALSEAFTQDLEDEPRATHPEPPPAKATSSADLRSQIWAHIKQQAPDITGREEAGRWVMKRTGYALVESNFSAILHALAVG